MVCFFVVVVVFFFRFVELSPDQHDEYKTQMINNQVKWMT